MTMAEGFSPPPGMKMGQKTLPTAESFHDKKGPNVSVRAFTSFMNREKI